MKLYMMESFERGGGRYKSSLIKESKNMEDKKLFYH